jgi:tetratricopeptide (TPR) repeat protein
MIMSTKMQLAQWFLAGAMTIAALPAYAVDTPTTKDAPDLTLIRAKIKAKDFKTAAADLYAVIDSGVQHADVYNLLGFSLRKSGDKRTGATFYRKALDFDPNHKGALEYQGELFVELGQIDEAKANLAKLATLCPSGCEEREDLEKTIASAASGATPKTN